MTLIATGTAGAATFVVNSTLDAVDVDLADSACDAEPDRIALCTLRAAVQQANVSPGADTIELPAGVYLLDVVGSGEDFAQSGDLDILDDLEIVGAGAGATVVDGNLTDRVFHVAEGVEATLRRLTIRRGRRLGSLIFPAGPGGGLLNEGTAHLRDVVLRDNEADSGGGLFNASEELAGGGDAGSAEATLVRVTVDGNVASALAGGGGGIFNGGVLEIEESTISRNSVPPEELGSPPSSLLPILFEGFGGGLRNWSTGNAVLVNTTISMNTTGNGGGIANDGNLFVAASTLAFNIGQFDGDQLYNEDWALLKGSILGGATYSTPCGGTAAVDSLGDNLEDGNSCGLDPRLDQTGFDPLLFPLGDWGGPTETHALSTSSPALDAMVDCRRLPLAPLTGDQRGAPRPMDGDGDGSNLCDIGAYEVLPAGLVFFDRFEGGDTSAWSVTSPPGPIAAPELLVRRSYWLDLDEAASADDGR